MAGDTLNPSDAESALLEATRSIGQEVLEQTGGDHYRSGQPLRNTPESAEPTSAEVATTSTAPKPKTETPTVEEPKGFGPGGKYKSMEDWERGTIEAGNTISQLRRELDEREARLRAIEQTVQPKQPEAPKDPLDEIENFGIPKDPVKQAIRSEFQNMMAEMGKAYSVRAEADRAVISQYPEYQERFNDLQGWLAQHPEENQAVVEAERQGQFKLAREYAWLKFREANGSQEEAQKIEESKTQAKVKAQRMFDAAVSDAKSGHTRDQSTAPKDPNQVTGEELQRVQNLSKAGYERKAWAEMLGPLLPDEKYFQ